MLRKELRDTNRLDEAGLEVQYGTCRFCHQLVSIYPLIGPWPQDKADECAAEICGCPRSVTYAGRKQRKERADELIRIKFGGAAMTDEDYIENSVKVCECLSIIASAVVDELIGKTTVSVTGRIKCTISLNARGDKIKIERTITKKDTGEV